MRGLASPNVQGSTARRFLSIAVLGVLLLAVGRLAWGAPPQPAALKVAATIFPLYDLVRQVAGPAVEVVLLVPPGASEHTFAVKPGTVRALTGCRAIFAIGHGLDDWVTRLAREAGVQRTIVPDAGIPLRRGYSEHHHGDGHVRSHTKSQDAVDPHYWLSIPNASRMVHNIADGAGPARSASQGRLSAARRGCIWSNSAVPMPTCVAC